MISARETSKSPKSQTIFLRSIPFFKFILIVRFDSNQSCDFGLESKLQFDSIQSCDLVCQIWLESKLWFCWSKLWFWLTDLIPIKVVILDWNQSCDLVWAKLWLSFADLIGIKVSDCKFRFGRFDWNLDSLFWMAFVFPWRPQ